MPGMSLSTSRGAVFMKSRVTAGLKVIRWDGNIGGVKFHDSGNTWNLCPLCQPDGTFSHPPTACHHNPWHTYTQRPHPRKQWGRSGVVETGFSLSLEDAEWRQKSDDIIPHSLIRLYLSVAQPLPHLSSLLYHSPSLRRGQNLAIFSRCYLKHSS